MSGYEPRGRGGSYRGRGGGDRGRGGGGGGGADRGRGRGGGEGSSREEGSAARGNKEGMLSTRVLLRIFSPKRNRVFNPGTPAVLDRRLQDKSDDALIQSFRSLKLRDTDLPTRPGFGTQGRAIKLRANFFPVTGPKGPIFEYDVAITPAAGTAAKRVKRRIFQLAQQTQDWTRHGLKGMVAHDHAAKLISAKKLVQPLAITAPYYDEDEQGPKAGGKEYVLTITFVQELDMSGLLRYVSSLCTPTHADDILDTLRETLRAKTTTSSHWSQL